MATIFTRIIAGEIPGRFVWRDPICVGMVDIRPLNRGHCLVIPIAEIDHWTEVPDETGSHLYRVAAAIGRAQQAVFEPARIGLMVAGFEVPHTHLHVVPINGMRHLDFANADGSARPSDLDEVRQLLADRLHLDGYAEAVDPS